MQSTKSDQLRENPRESANPFSALMFCYALPILFKGRKKTLEQEDLYRELREHKADSLGDKLCAAWHKEVSAASRKDRKPSLLKCINRVFGWHIILTGAILGFLEIITKVTQPICLAGLIAYFSGIDESLTNAQLFAGGIILTTLANVMFMHPYILGLLHLGMKMRIALCSLIYRKSLRLSRTAFADTTIGQVVNLTSNDVGRFDSVLINVHYLWLAPLELVIVTYFMYKQIGVSSIFGVGVMVLFLPLQSYLGKRTSVLRLRTALCTDKRVRMMNEIILGIQVIKMYAWEKPFGKLIEKARFSEMSVIKRVNYIRGILLSFSVFLSRVSIFASLVGYVLMGQILDAQKAFMVTAYYNILRRTVTMFFPMGISQFAELLVSIGRIQTFMMRDEIAERSKKMNFYECDFIKDDKLLDGKKVMAMGNTTKSNGHALSVDENFIEIVNLKAKWDPDSIEYNLDEVNLKLKAGQLVAIIGPVGSGKSSFIQAILGELPPTSGSIKINGTFSYASQEPWLFTGSVRDNILFGLEMDKKRYHTVIKKCALERDFELLPYGDKSIVGERGVSLSGGQKSRISLARAVYRQADVYLLDDPLSAVDTHVGKHLFDQCMRGFLRSKLVMLVTHQLQFLEKADIIVIMDKGKVTAMGTYESMLKSGLDFAHLLTDSNEKNNDDVDSDANKNYSRQSSQQSYFTERQNTISSMSSAASSVLPDSPMQVHETRVVGKIGLSMYHKYFCAGAGFLMISFLIFLCVITQAIASGADFFLSYWVKKDKDQESMKTNPVDIYYFSALNIAVVVLTLVRTLLFFNVATRSSNKLHNDMFNGIIRAAMYFFNVNPSGRILNRFSKDLGQLDEILPSVMLDVIQIFLTLVGIIIVLCIMNLWNLLVTVILFIIFYFLRQFYLKTSRDVKRLESVARSPIYSHLGATLNGLSTIRAFDAEKLLISEFDNYQDLHSSAYYSFLSTNRAFGYYLDLFCTVYIVIITLNFFFMPPKDGGEVGLAITQAMGMTGMVQYGIRQSAELENTMTAVERIVEYDDIEPEGEFESAPAKKPLATWPEKGEIVANDLSMRYFPNPKSDSVLKSVNFEFKFCEKIGIVGRTGAGKSSIINALFRLSYNDGTVLIDNCDTAEIGLYDLRSKISIIPQEPVIFSGTMRYNLDPFEQYDDAKLWAVLEEVKLKEVITEMPTGLQSNISEGGTNFSVGQRQLVCLARAILRENKILVMDEATANVDPQTDALIQITIRKKFKDCTVVTIAHRLHTIMDSDKVLVMDAGRVVEFGSPYELLTQSKTKIFHGMVKQTGKTTYENLFKIAEKTHASIKKVA